MVGLLPQCAGQSRVKPLSGETVKMMTCPTCGEPLQKVAGTAFCPRCREQEQQVEPPPAITIERPSRPMPRPPRSPKKTTAGRSGRKIVKLLMLIATIAWPGFVMLTTCAGWHLSTQDYQKYGPEYISSTGEVVDEDVFLSSRLTGAACCGLTIPTLLYVFAMAILAAIYFNVAP